MCARIVLSRYPSANSTEKMWSALTTAGNSTRTPANARSIPSLTEDSKLKCERIYAGSYPCAERDGYVWAYMANPEGRGLNEPPPAPPELPTFSANYKIAHLYADLPCGVDQAIIGLMDPAHGPFVHQAWWWRSRRSIRDKEKKFKPIPNGFRMSPHAPSANSAPYKILKFLTGEPATTMIDFVLPNQRFEQIRAGRYWLSSRTTVTPVRRDLCGWIFARPGTFCRGFRLCPSSSMCSARASSGKTPK